VQNSRLIIVSGGQTGVDRAALDAAIGAGIPYTGWCPSGGWAEDLPDPPGVRACYPDLRETPERNPEQRTAWNVRDSDALMVMIGRAGLGVSKGTALAFGLADDFGKPYIVIDVDAPDALAKARAFLAETVREGREGARLCIGGPRESEAPGIYMKAKTLLAALLGA
jgi:hypothetical protein